MQAIVVKTMKPESVPSGHHLTQQLRVLNHLLADDEEGRDAALLLEDLQYLPSRDRIGTVIEGEGEARPGLTHVGKHRAEHAEPRKQHTYRSQQNANDHGHDHPQEYDSRGNTNDRGRYGHDGGCAHVILSASTGRRVEIW